MPAWSDFFKLFTYAFQPDPLSLSKDSKGITGAGVTTADAIPDIRQDGSFSAGGKGFVRLRDTNDFIDLSSVTNRQSRYKEYERLRNVPEIETSMTIMADEACQKGENNHVLEIICKNEEIKKELEFLFFNRKMLNIDRKIWSATKNTLIQGDFFYELVIDPDNPKLGILKIQELPCDSIYRIETTKGKLIEFQQSKEGPDYESLTRAPITQATEAELQQAKALRFAPEQIVHIKIGDDRKLFYPYGQSLVEPARGPAHQLRLMEDAMVVYRLTRAPERRVFYIDVGSLPPYKAEAFMERMKDVFRKKKVATSRGGGMSGSAVDERWHAPASDEDYWIPVRPNANTRVETLPGAQNLGEIDDAVYFRNKLYTALNFPKNYMSSEDPQTTRMALSALDVRFARMIERLQSHIEDGMWQIAERHLKLRGYPEEEFEDLVIKMTPPSEWRELSRQEVVSNRINNASSLKGSMLYSDYDIFVKVLKIGENEAKQMLSRMKIQKLDDLKLQVLSQNPQLLGVGVPSAGEPEMGAQAGGPNPMLTPDQEGQPPESGAENQPPEGQPSEGGIQSGQEGAAPQGGPLPEPTSDELKKYDLQVQTYSKEADHEDIDFSEQ